jgi:hypothetical protein
MLTLLIKGINKSDHLPLFYNNLLNKISMGISFKKKRSNFHISNGISLSFAMKFQWRHWLGNFAWHVECVTQKLRLSSVSFLSVYLSSVVGGRGVVCYKGFAPHRFEVFRCLTWLYHINLVCGFFIIIIFIQYTNTIPVGGWVSPGVVSAGVGNTE